MPAPPTSILDHIVYLTSPGTIKEASQQFRDLGFNVIEGGADSEGFSDNALVIFDDGTYLILISLIHPVSHYASGSPERQRCENIPWLHKKPGWIACALLDTSNDSKASMINARTVQDNSGVRYASEASGGRTRPDGQVLEWEITAPEDHQLLGTFPFICRDITPRELRVPTLPSSNVVHPSCVKGVAHLRVLVEPGSLASVSAQLTSVIGEPSQSNIGQRYTWTFERPSSLSNSQKPQLILSVPENDEEETHLATNGPGIYEVAVLIGSDGVEKEVVTPYGSKIVWLKSS